MLTNYLTTAFICSPSNQRPSRWWIGML